MMPRLDGYAVLGCMKSHEAWRHIPVIMISALTDQSSVVRCIAEGAEDYLPKPFEPVLLEARIGACLERKRLHDREVAHLDAIERERRRADELLHAILPAPAVAELKVTGRVLPRLFGEVAVLFVDLVGFTAWCHAHPPKEVVANVQRLAESFEALADRHDMEKIKTIGDAFMATANLLRPHADPVMAAVRCACYMVSAAHAEIERLADPGRHPHRSRGRWRRRADEVQLRPVGRHCQRGGAAFLARQRGRHLPFSGRFRTGSRPLHASGGRASPAQG